MCSDRMGTGYLCALRFQFSSAAVEANAVHPSDRRVVARLEEDAIAIAFAFALQC